MILEFKYKNVEANCHCLFPYYRGVFHFFCIMKLIDVHDELGTSHGTADVEILSRMPAFVSGNPQLLRIGKVKFCIPGGIEVPPPQALNGSIAILLRNTLFFFTRF